MSSHDLGICMRLMKISNPFNANSFVELKFIIPECGAVAGGGELHLRVAVEDAPRYMLGDSYYIHLRSL